MQNMFLAKKIFYVCIVCANAIVLIFYVCLSVFWLWFREKNLEVNNDVRENKRTNK